MQACQGLANREPKFSAANILCESDFTYVLVQNYYLAVIKHTNSLMDSTKVLSYQCFLEKNDGICRPQLAGSSGLA